MAKCGAGGDWEYPAVDEVLDAAGLQPIRVFIKRRKINKSGEGGLTPRICTVNSGGANSVDDPDGALVGSRRGK